MIKANIKGDLWHVYIDNAQSPFLVSVSAKGFIDLSTVTAMQTGSTPIAHLINGFPIELDFIWKEWEIESVKRALGITAETPTSGKYSLPKVGTQMPTHSIRLHDPNAADTSEDLVFPQVVFDGMDRTADGKDEAMFSNTARAEVGPEGFACEIGYVAP